MRKILIICLFLTVSLFFTDRSYGFFGMDQQTYVITYSCGSGTGVPPASHETYLAGGSSGSGPTTPDTATLNPANNTCTPPNGQIFAGWLIDGSTTVTTPVQPGVEIQWTEGHDGLLIAQYQNDPSDLNTNNPTCVYGTLHTYTGPVDIEANFVPNTINTQWYSDGVQITGNNVPSTCTYDTAMTLPTNPTKAGYEFNGWRLRIQCNIPSTDVSNNANACAAKALNGVTVSTNGGATPATYGLERPGEWGVSWSNGDKVTGVALCSAHSGNNHSYQWGGDSSDWTSDETTLTSATGEYCWCKATHYTANNAQQCSLSSPAWVFYYSYGPAAPCATNCANNCASIIRYNSAFRAAIFTGLVAQ